MQITMHDTLVPTANRMLGNLANFLDKAAAFAEAKKFDATVLLNSRLAPDMGGSGGQKVVRMCDLSSTLLGCIRATETA